MRLFNLVERPAFMAEGKHRFISNGDGWARELSFMFVLGALAASLFWLAVWYVQAKPAHAGALQEKDVVVRKLETQRELCTAQTQQLTDANRRLDAEVAGLDRKLKQAWAAHARCLQGN
jgi:hypothetical protein